MRRGQRDRLREGYLHHIVRHDPAAKSMSDPGVLAVKNPDSTGRSGRPSAVQARVAARAKLLHQVSS